MRDLKFWYQAFSWVPPVVETQTNKRGKERRVVRMPGYYKRNHEVGSILTSGEGTRKQEYEVQESGALVNLTKKRKKYANHE